MDYDNQVLKEEYSDHFFFISRFEATLARPRQRLVADRVGQVDQAGLQRGGEVEHREGHARNQYYRVGDGRLFAKRRSGKR